MVRNTLRYSLGSVLVALVSLSATGCMTSPYHGQELIYWDDTFDATGFTVEPNETVLVECYDSVVDRWRLLGEARSATTPHSWAGQDWYYWSVDDIEVPYQCWDPVANHNYKVEAKIRAIIPGQPLVELITFVEPFGECWAFDKTVADLVECAHEERSATITSFRNGSIPGN